MFFSPPFSYKIPVIGFKDQSKSWTISSRYPYFSYTSLETPFPSKVPIQVLGSSENIFWGSSLNLLHTIIPSWKNSSSIFHKVRHKLTMWPRKGTPKHLPMRSKNTCTHKYSEQRYSSQPQSGKLGTVGTFWTMGDCMFVGQNAAQQLEELPTDNVQHRR